MSVRGVVGKFGFFSEAVSATTHDLSRISFISLGVPDDERHWLLPPKLRAVQVEAASFPTPSLASFSKARPLHFMHAELAKRTDSCCGAVPQRMLLH